MDYAKSYFGKSLDSLTYQNVEDFFKEAREESTRIEFKSYSAQHGNFKKNLEGVIRGLCALLNSEGGILIWGAPEGQKATGKQEDIFQGVLSPVNELKEKDGLINTISDTINPLPVGITVKILDNGSNQCVYVFEVQVSNYRPHQYKHIYYARLDGQTRPAPHYLVEALMRRITYPNIEAYLKITNKQINRTGETYSFILDIDMMICNFSEFQNEEDVLLDVTVGPGVFYRWESNTDPTKSYSQDGHRLRIENLIKTLHFGLHAVHSERIVVPEEKLSGTRELSIGPYEVMIMILFGGKSSPMKSSKYVVDVGRSVTNYNYNALIVNSEENITMADRQRSLGAKKEDFLKHYLGR